MNGMDVKKKLPYWELFKEWILIKNPKRWLKRVLSLQNQQQQQILVDLLQRDLQAFFC